MATTWLINKFKLDDNGYTIPESKKVIKVQGDSRYNALEKCYKKYGRIFYQFENAD